MIYLDCAATSLQKPKAVAVSSCMAIRSLASPGRGSHIPAMRAADCVYDCRELLAGFFNVSEPENVIFTSNATHALNIAIASLVSEGDKVVISGYEHNAVVRPLNEIGAQTVVATSPLFDQAAVVSAFSENLEGAACAVCTHVSNVFGFILPIEEIAALCRERGVPLIIDASQSAGVLPIDFAALDVAFAAMPGHKGLLGPQGTGVLLCNSGTKPVLYGGTGSNSLLPVMPDYLPDRLEAGTHNVAGIAGLAEGIKYLNRLRPNAVIEHERRLKNIFISSLADTEGIRLFYTEKPECQSGVVSVVTDSPGCDELAELLGKRGVCVRSGLHCAPIAHDSAGTTDTGTVRFSFSPFNTPAQVRAAAFGLKKILNFRAK